jgi:hypothetical protein
MKTQVFNTNDEILAQRLRTNDRLAGFLTRDLRLVLQLFDYSDFIS